MLQEVRARTVAGQLAGEFLRNGNYEAARGAIDVQTMEGVLPAASIVPGVGNLPEYGFAGLSVQSIGYSYGSDEEIVYVYVTKGGRRALSSLSTEVGGIKIQVTNVGKLIIRPEAISAASNMGNFYERGGRIACGSSCAPSGIYSHGTGTFGALVSSNRGMMALSNNHVFAACNHVPVGQPILSPSVADARPGIPAPRLLCYHADIVELRSGFPPLVPLGRCDAAIADVSDQDAVSSWQGDDITGYDTPSKPIDPFSGLRVKKVGRTTGLTFGTVEARSTPWALPYRNPNFAALVWFTDVWTVTADIGGQFALPGDSGSLVVTDDGAAAVGLLFASTPRGEYAYIAPINAVLTELNLALISNQGI